MALRENPTQSEVVKAIRELQESGGVSSVTSVNGQTGQVVITASDLDAYTKSETDAKLENYVTTNTDQTITGRKQIYELVAHDIYRGNTRYVSSSGDYCNFGSNQYEAWILGSKERPTYSHPNGSGDLALLSDIKGLPLGMIISSAVVQDDAGLHLLDGSALSRDGIYAGFCTWLTEKYNADNSSVPTCTEDDFYKSVISYGQCGKFVITNEYVRLPLITKFIEGIEKIGDIGKSLQAGVPNITGAIEGRPHLSGASSSIGGALVGSSGVFDFSVHGGSTTDAGTAESGNLSTRDIVRLDASIASSVYGRSDTVQPQATKYPYYIVVATMTKTDIEVNLDNVASDLNLKANSDLSNVDDNIFKSKLGYEQVETIYDMASSDSSINLGYTSGIMGGLSNLKINLSKYKMIRISYQTHYSTADDNGGTGNIALMDLTRKVDGRSIGAFENCYINGGNPIANTFKLKILYNHTTNVFYHYFAYGTTLKQNASGYFISKIEGIY